MLPATIQTWTYTGRLQLKHLVPNGNKTFGNLLRTRKYFTNGHMHIYSIPPMSRMNCKQKIVPKLLCSDLAAAPKLDNMSTIAGIIGQSTCKFKRAFFRHDPRTAPKFGTHVRIETRLALTKNKLTNPTPEGFRGLFIACRPFVRPSFVRACGMC